VHRTTQKDERQLFTRLRAAPTPGNRGAAVRRYLPLARGIAARYRCSAEPVQDVERVAAIGLVIAIDRFDPDCGTAFTNYAVRTIVSELCRHFGDRTSALGRPPSQGELILKVEQARAELTTLLGRHPTVAELSRRLELDQEVVLDLGQKLFMARTFVHLHPTSGHVGR
jgi:RNA polymerase sigma-B factor